MRERADMCSDVPLRHEFIHGDNGRGPHCVKDEMARNPLGDARACERFEVQDPVLAAVALRGFEDGGGVSTLSAWGLSLSL